MELALNLVWALGAIALLAWAWRGVRRGANSVSMGTAIVAALLIAVICLPVISVTDDFLAAEQAALPLAGQTWRVATEGAGSGLDALASIAVYLLLLLSFLIAIPIAALIQWSVRPLSAWLVQAQRLRPPPYSAGL